MVKIRSVHIPQTMTTRVLLHYIFAVDISGSMSGDLAKLREDLKHKIATQLRPGQYLTIIYYSSNGQCGRIFDGFELQNADSVTVAGNAIDNWLRPMSLTGFVEPMSLAYESIMKFKQQQIDSVFTFMSDGYENQNNRETVLNVCKRVGAHALATYVVEYGDYANHSLLQEMAETMFGQLIVAGELQQYSLMIDSVLGTESMVSFTVVPSEEDKVAFVRMANGFIRSWKVDNGPFEIIIEPTQEVFIASTHPNDDDADSEQMLCTVLALFQIGDNVTLSELLGDMGDVDLIERFIGAIGKQRRNQFVELLQAYINDTSLLFRQPQRKNYMPHPNTPDIFDLFEILSKEPGNKLLVRSPFFKYKRGGVKIEDKALGPDKLEFDEYEGQAIDFESLVFHTSRANVGIRGKFNGTVDVSQHSKNPDASRIGVIPTHIFRTYNLVRDGIVVMDKIPVSLTAETIIALGYIDIHIEFHTEKLQLLDLTRIPVANMNRVSEAVDGLQFADNAYGLKILQAYQKVFRYYQGQMELKKSSTEWLDKYGPTGVEFLNEVGIHESNGFYPRDSFSVKSDFYYAPTVELKVSGHNSLPSVTDVLKRKEAGKKLKGAPLAMSNAIREYQKMMLMPEPHILLNEAVSQIVDYKRETEIKVASLVFANLLSRKPFRGFNNNEMTYDTNFSEGILVINYLLRVEMPTENTTFTLVEEEDEVAI